MAQETSMLLGPFFIFSFLIVISLSYLSILVAPHFHPMSTCSQKQLGVLVMVVVVWFAVLVFLSSLPLLSPMSPSYVCCQPLGATAVVVVTTPHKHSVNRGSQWWPGVGSTVIRHRCASLYHYNTVKTYKLLKHETK